MSRLQPSLYSSEIHRTFGVPFPTTRYQGSKRAIVDWIWENIRELEFDSALDLFGGTGAVSHMLKCMGARVTYNDILSFNWNIGLALVENNYSHLTEGDLEQLLGQLDIDNHRSFISDTFQGIYFTEEENHWLDEITGRIDRLLLNPYKRAIARFAVIQACISKRPYNLFHRANLYMRLADVQRGFGNKVTWETPFEVLFRKFVQEANTAIFDNGRVNRATRYDALKSPDRADLVYIDPPYLNSSGTGVDYLGFYHFLEGLVTYDSWANRIDYTSKHKRLRASESPWNRKDTICGAFDTLFSNHRESILVVSYRSDGLPTLDEIVRLLRKHKTYIRVTSIPKTYVLSKTQSKEMLIIAE